MFFFFNSPFNSLHIGSSKSAALLTSTDIYWNPSLSCSKKDGQIRVPGLWFQHWIEACHISRKSLQWENISFLFNASTSNSSLFPTQEETGPTPAVCSASFTQSMASPPVSMNYFPRSTGVHAKSLQLCPTLGNPMDCSLPGSSVHGILQGKILERVTMPSFRGSSWRIEPMSLMSLALAGGFFTTSATWEAPSEACHLKVRPRGHRGSLPGPSSLWHLTFLPTFYSLKLPFLAILVTPLKPQFPVPLLWCSFLISL